MFDWAKKNATKSDLIDLVKADLQQLYGQPDTAGECLADTYSGVFEYALNHNMNLDHNGYNNVLQRLMIKAGVLVDHDHIRDNNGQIRPTNVQDVRNIFRKFVTAIK